MLSNSHFTDKEAENRKGNAGDKRNCAYWQFYHSKIIAPRKEREKIRNIQIQGELPQPPNQKN